ncbi:MAG: type VI secretion system ImpA family N-terminal domain-containing protein, partial [Deltaproteobacteria bacterium]|nr:type VI secretion system ImpA family N-terminal domain-containing protein [Deltaproteobacteria bacterium]
MDLASLGKQPVSEKAPTGADVRYEPAFEELQAEIDKLSNPSASGEMDWNKVNTLAAQILSEQAKDLLVASYLAVAQIHTAGIEGFGIGLSVYRDLLETFWEDLFPKKKRMRGRIAA